MSLASFAVTYTSVYTDSEPGRVFWGADEELSDRDSPRVIMYGYDGLPMLPVAPPSPDYVPGPEEPQTPPAPQDKDEHEPMFIQLHDPDFMPDPIYPEYIPLEDEHILMVEEQPLPPVASPTTESPEYVAESDLEEDPDEYEDDETEDGQVDYPMDGGDDDDDDSSRDDADDEDEDEGDEEEEHLASADSAVVIHINELVSLPEETELAAISFPPEAEVERLLARPTSSPLPLASLSPPSAVKRLARCTTLAALPSPPLPPPLHMPPPVDRKDDIPETEMPPRQSNNKRKADDSFRNNHGHQQQTPKRQNVARVYNMGTGERKSYSGNLPKCTKCHFHHNGPCTQKCHKCNKVGHFARDCRSSGNANVTNAQRNNGENPNGNGCFECGATGHFKRDCPKLKNKDGGRLNVPGWVYAVGNAEKRGNASRYLDSNVITGTFLLNNRYVSILFDTGANRSFISTAFSSLIDIIPTSLGNSYDVELADGKIVRVDIIMRGCTLNFLAHPFNIDLMHIELGSFDVIISMELLRRCHAVIVCDEKLV
nr:hypothetical protein [Tanacetum cinerariifolium]